MRTTGGGASGSVRNLRIREDTAKYLLNLDPNSAYYDPKSRSMREDPNPQKVLLMLVKSGLKTRASMPLQPAQHKVACVNSMLKPVIAFEVQPGQGCKQLPSANGISTKR